MKQRYLFLDMLRGIAVLEMIHGHSLDALLAPVLRTTPFFLTWNHVRGYTAPIFLFASGLAFAISTLRKQAEYTHFSSVLVRRIRRILFVVLVGYLMYLPYFSLRKSILTFGGPEWQQFFSTDILRCIGVSILFLQLWYFLKPQRIFSFIAISVITFLLPLATPIIQNNAFVLGLPDGIKYYFVQSRFPLFYYSSYLLLGFLIGYLFCNKRKQWVYISLALGLVLVVLTRMPWILKTVPLLKSFMLKAGIIVIMSVVFERLEQVWKKLPVPVINFGQESFLVYVVHICILYGSPLNNGLRFFWGANLSYPEVYGEVIWLSAAMVLLAYLWHKVKSDNPKLYGVIRYSFYAMFILLFIVKPY